MKDILINTSYSESFIVENKDLANQVGSGLVAVLATPIMIAKMEHAASNCLAQFLDEGETSVGIMMNTTHDAATPCAMKVDITATITAIDRKKVSFEIIAKDEVDVIGKAIHDRFIVNKAKFEAKAKSKSSKD